MLVLTSCKTDLKSSLWSLLLIRSLMELSLSSFSDSLELKSGSVKS